MGKQFFGLLVVFLSLALASPAALKADAISDTPIAFVTMVPNPRDFGTLAATFGNHVSNPTDAFRGGDLWIRYPDGSLKNITEAAGYGNSGFQGASAIAVREPAVHWDGAKIIFSMVVGNPTQQYQLTSTRWQLYEVTGIGPLETPVISKVPNQPANYNNVSPAYASDDTIIFASDRPRDDSVLHTYPQRDEYESSPVNSGLWKLNPNDGGLKILDHSPSGNFNPIIDSFGRVIFTRWDHLQRDQQNVGVDYGAFNYESEASSTKLNSALEVFPEPRSNVDPDRKANVNLHTINQFFPWMMNQDGTDLETLNHIGRQEIGVYSERSFNDDPNVQEFYGQYSTGQNQNEFSIFLHIKEDPTRPGTYLGTNCQEFATHSSGQILSINGPPGLNPDNMVVTYLTHPDTSGASNNPSGNHTGLYRDPLPLSNGTIIASHTSETREDTNIGSSANPLSRYAIRLKLLSKPGAYYQASTAITGGISKSVSFWSPDNMISYNGPLWEMMPVEVKSRARPQAASLAVPAIEQSVISNMGISLDELSSYLRSQNLALVVSRNLTVRDRNDRQQPTNLRVTGTSTQSLPKAGKIYDISLMQFFQGDLIRGYAGNSTSGRRVIAQEMHSVPSGVNPIISDAIAGATKVAEDGSMAAFVPARRALTWQLTDAAGVPVVRERYWVTFQPGEIRVCSSCHGVNTADQLGNTGPTNPPLALAQLLAHWKNLPPPVFTPTPTPPGSDPNPSPEDGFSIAIAGLPKIKAGGKFILTAQGSEDAKMKLRVAIDKVTCQGNAEFPSSAKGRLLIGKLPLLSASKVAFSLMVDNKAKASTQAVMPKLKKRDLKKKRLLSKKAACVALLKSLKKS